MTGVPIDRRKLLGGLTLGASGLLLAGCDQLNADPTFRSLIKGAENLHRVGQRAVAPGLAREYARSDMSPFFRTNGNATADTPEYQAHAANRFADWKLVVDGMVARPLGLSLHDLGSLPQRAQITRHDCVEGWSAIGKWQGPQLAAILRAAGLSSRARYIVFHCADVEGGKPYYESIDLDDAFHPQTILAVLMNDHALPIGHGAPVRLRVERHLGYKHAKFVMRVEARDRIDNIYGGKGGYWEDRADYAWYAGI